MFIVLNICHVCPGPEGAHMQGQAGRWRMAVHWGVLGESASSNIRGGGRSLFPTVHKNQLFHAHSASPCPRVWLSLFLLTQLYCSWKPWTEWWSSDSTKASLRHRLFNLSLQVVIHGPSRSLPSFSRAHSLLCLPVVIYPILKPPAFKGQLHNYVSFLDFPQSMKDTISSLSP